LAGGQKCRENEGNERGKITQSHGKAGLPAGGGAASKTPKDPHKPENRRGRRQIS
jgi:hypothetical protein